MVSEKEKEKRPSIHQGHRKRVKEEFLARGLNGMSEHRVLELLLFYAIPQGDVNPLAHALVDRFGGLEGVFHATVEQLMQVKGVGLNTATLIQLVPAVAGYYMGRQAEVNTVLTELWQFRELLMPLFFGQREEVAYLLCMDGKNKLINYYRVGEGVADQLSLTVRKVAEVALVSGATRVAMAHNHVSGIAIPSGADLKTTEMLWEFLMISQVELIDHFIIAGDEMVSMRASGYFNTFRLRGLTKELMFDYNIPVTGEGEDGSKPGG